MSNSILNYAGPTLGTFKPSLTNDRNVKLPENPANIADHMKYGLALDKLLEKAVVAGVADAKELLELIKKNVCSAVPGAPPVTDVMTILCEKAACRPIWHVKVLQERIVESEEVIRTPTVAEQPTEVTGAF